jgi:hypothetical protein
MIKYLKLLFSKKAFIFVCTLVFVLIFLKFSPVYCDTLIIKKLFFPKELQHLSSYNEFAGLNTKYFCIKNINSNMDYGWAFTHNPKGRPSILLGDLDLVCDTYTQYLIKRPYIFHSAFSNLVTVEKNNLPCLFNYEDTILRFICDENNLKNSINIGEKFKSDISTFRPTNKTFIFIQNTRFDFYKKV